MITFIDVLRCSKKNELAKICKSHAVTEDDFVSFILFCQAGECHLNHIMTYHDYVPEDLETTEEDFAILDASKKEQQSKKGQSSFRRLFKTHGQRKYRVGHMFFEGDGLAPNVEWHFIFFDINETEKYKNHWVGGPHFHITNHLWPNLHWCKVWDDFATKRAYPKTKLHVRYNKGA